MTAGDIAYACFTSCQQSHPFEDRRIPLITNDEPIKVGRAVAKLRATSENAIFDCKVLSRNHAMFWYADGKFYLKDTKSSNGTFVNNQRLSKGSEESPAKEIFSGDIVQFGVEIVENARQVTHGCIVAMVRLYLPDGREAVTPSSYSNNDPNFRPVSPTSNVGPSLFTTLTNQELFQLQQYIKEAAHREQMLETKLQSLQALVANTQHASQDGWQALIDEDRLLSRIDTLENQLSIYVKNVGEDKLREKLHELNEERFRYEVSAKESLRRALQEKMEAVQRLTDVERSLETTEDECARLRQDCESAQNELQVLATQHTDALVRIHSLSTQLEEAERRAKEAQDRFDKEKAELDAKISEMTRHESLLTAKVETLQSENDFDKEQLAAMKVRLDQLSVELDGIGAEQRYSRKSESSTVQNEETMVGEDESVGEISERLNATVDELNMYRKQLTESGTELGESKQLVQQLTSELAQAKLEMLSSAALVSDLEDLIVSNERRYAHAVDDAMRAMISNCEDAVLQKHRNEELMDYLREQVAQLENKLKSIRFNNSQRTMLNGRSNDAESIHQNGDGHGLSGDSYSVHDQYRHWVDVELENYKEQLRKSEELRERSDAMSKNLTKQIENYETRLTDACAEVEDMKELLTAEQDRCQILSDDVRLLKLELDETQTKAKERLSESEELRSKVTLLTEELELERSLRVHDSLDDENARVVLHLQAARNQAEFASLREECATLRERIAGIETEMKTSRKDNARLSSENQRLKHSYDLLMQQKACLENEEGSWRYQVDTARYESDILRNQLNEAREELMALREKRLEMEKEHSWTARNKGMGDNAMDQKYDELEMKTRTVTFCSAIPLFFLFVAILVAFLPFFSTLTATNSASGNDSQQ